MSEQEFIPARDKNLENKLSNFLKENQGSAFTLIAISNRLEEIIKDPVQLEYAKENLQEILNRMASDRTIVTIEHSGEMHYFIEKAEKKTPEVRKINLEPVKQWIFDNRVRLTGWLILLGILVGLGSFLSRIISEILIPLCIILITITALIEIATVSKQFKENSKYRPPIYGIVALVFTVFGLILLNMFRSGSFLYGGGGFEMLYAIPISIVAIIGGATGLYGEKDDRPVAAMSGLFFGGIILIKSLWPLIYYLVSFIAVFYV